MGIHSKKNRPEYLNILIAMILLSSIAFLFVFPLHSETGIFLPQKGMSYITWDKHRLASKYSDESLKKLVSLGVSHIAICVTYYQEKYNSTKIHRTNRTPSDRSLIHAIKKVHKLGMQVMFKPHIDLIDKYDGTYWRADIGFNCEHDWKKWFKEYRKYITHYARMAEKLQVEIFCIGTELSWAAERESDWRDLISHIRKIYSGKIVYAANWDNFQNIKFWQELDYIGIDAYFPLTYETAPTMESLKKGWEKWSRQIEIWQARINKPVIFTEIGYPSTSHAPCMPWKGGFSGNADTEIQAACYKAFFETIWEKPWLEGVYWWKWDTNIHAGGQHNRQFTPQNKPAQKILEEHYKTS